jgi:hypothetical protein
MFPATPPLSFDLLSSPLLPTSIPSVLPQGMTFDPFDFAGTFPLEPTVSQLSMMSDSRLQSSHEHEDGDVQSRLQGDNTTDPSLPLDFTSKPISAVDRPRAVVGSRGKGLQLVHRFSRPPMKATTRTGPRTATGALPATTTAATVPGTTADLKARRLGYHSRGRPAGMHEGTDPQVMLHLAASYPDLRVQTLARTILTQQEQLEARLALSQVTHERLSRMHATLLTMTDSLKTAANAHTTVAHKVVVMLQAERSRTKSHSRKSALKAMLSKHPLAAMLAKRMSTTLPPHTSTSTNTPVGLAARWPPIRSLQHMETVLPKMKSRSKSKSKRSLAAAASTTVAIPAAPHTSSSPAPITAATVHRSSPPSSSLLSSDGNSGPRQQPPECPAPQPSIITGTGAHAFVAASHGSASRGLPSPINAPLTGVKRPITAISSDEH